jgi:hypothetical protein
MANRLTDGPQTIRTNRVAKGLRRRRNISVAYGYHH